MYDELTLETMAINLTAAPNDSDLERLSNELQAVPGTHLTSVAGQELTIEFYPEVSSENLVRKAVDRAGLITQPPEKQGFFARTRQRLAESNERTFGGASLSCCGLNDKDSSEKGRSK